MADAQPPNVVEGATTGDIDEEVPIAAKSAEDRKAAAALSSLDAAREDESSARDIDQEAVRKAMARLDGSTVTNGTSASKTGEKKVVKKIVKVDPADVTLLVEELELSKIKATDLLKAHDGDAGKALKAYITPITT